MKLRSNVGALHQGEVSWLFLYIHMYLYVLWVLALFTHHEDGEKAVVMQQYMRAKLASTTSYVEKDQGNTQASHQYDSGSYSTTTAITTDSEGRKPRKGAL